MVSGRNCNKALGRDAYFENPVGGEKTRRGAEQ